MLDTQLVHLDDKCFSTNTLFSYLLLQQINKQAETKEMKFNVKERHNSTQNNGVVWACFWNYSMCALLTIVNKHHKTHACLHNTHLTKSRDWRLKGDSYVECLLFPAPRAFVHKRPSHSTQSATAVRIPTPAAAFKDLLAVTQIASYSCRMPILPQNATSSYPLFSSS